MKIDKRTNEGKQLLRDIGFNTLISTRKIEEAFRLIAEVTLDIEHKQRIKEFRCKNCYYDTVFTTQGFTTGTCKICNNRFSHHNGATPKLCEECAEDNILCKQCMGDLHYDTVADQRKWI